MLPKNPTRHEFIPRNHRPTKEFHKPSLPMPYYTQEELDLLDHLIRQSALEHMIWGTRIVPFTDLKSLHDLIRTEPIYAKMIFLSFKKLPLYLFVKDEDDYYEHVWYQPVVKWRLQIGR